MAIHDMRVAVTFGDCDPAGIVYYPNTYRWMDGCFHGWMRTFGGHAAVCARIGSVGIGLRDASARFRRPMRDGDPLVVMITGIEWQDRSLVLDYVGAVGETEVFTGRETRALFVETAAGMRAGQMELLRAVVEGDGQGT